MKFSFNLKTLVYSAILVSGLCAVLLQFHIEGELKLLSETAVLEASIKEGAYLPDVKLLKELIKSIFNIVRFQ